MKVVAATAYLQNKQVPTEDRFKVVSGWDTKAQAKHPTDRSNWASQLGDEKLLAALVMKEATASLGGFFKAVGSAIAGNDLATTLKTAYKTAIVENANTQNNQEAYIQLVIDLMVKHQNTDELQNFEFTDPKDVLALEVTTALQP